MVIAKNIGRLGNNMLQIAAAIGYARKYGYEWAVDPNSGVGEPYSSIHQTFPNLPKGHFGGGIRYHEHPNEFCQIHGVHKNECHFDYHEIPNLGANVNLTGFFQSWKYFEHCKDEVKKVFELTHIPGYEDYVSIHVRRGDYVNYSSSFPPIDDKYLLNATNIIDLGICRVNYLIFSDDIKWCKEYFIKYGDVIQYSEGKSDREDLSLMASCGHHIIANSTFSWWGAYLGHNPNRIVISPSCVRGNWFGLQSGVKRDVVDLLPPEWTQIKFR